MKKGILTTTAGTVKFSLSKTIWLYFTIIPIGFINWSAINLKIILLFIALLILTVGIGHSIGLHRGIIHKSYKTSPWFRNLAIYLFVLTGLGSPLNWLKQHYFRDYWQNRRDCPRYFRYQHSIFTDYLWNLHYHFTPKEIGLYEIPKEDLNDSWIVWLHKTWYIHNIAFIIIIYSVFGLNTMLFITFFRSGLVMLGHWYIGYASHKFGYARHEIEGADESGYNDIILGLLSFGEGFHNNHHSYPNSARFSSKWYEIDFSWILILILKKLNIVTDINTQEYNLKTTARSYKVTKWKLPWQ